jgi:hypothetical protein
MNTVSRRRHDVTRRLACRKKKSSGKKAASGVVVVVMPTSDFWFNWLVLLIPFFTDGATALSSSLSLSSLSSCKIVGTPGGRTTQYLPTSYIPSFGRWIVVNHQLMPLPFPPTTTSTTSTATAAAGDDAGPPVAAVAVQATLDILVKSGTPTYVMAGLQVQQQSSSSSSASSYTYSTPPWTAHQWVTFGSVVEPDFRVVLLLQGSSTNRNNGDESDDENVVAPAATKIVAVATTDDIRVALEDLGLALQQSSSCNDGSTSENDDDDDESASSSSSSSLEQGFHIVSLPLKMTKTSRDVAVTSSGIDVSQEPWSSTTTDDYSNSKLDWIPVNMQATASSSSSSTTPILTCLATAEVNARELLSLDPTLLEMTVTSILQVPLSSSSV